MMVRSSGCKTTSLKEEAALDGARVARRGDGAVPQFDYAPRDAGAPRPARRIARDPSLGSSSTPASPDPPRAGDPSAPRARAPSLIRWWLTAYACLTPWQASISRARPCAATMALWAAGRRMALFVAMLLWAVEAGRRAPGRARRPVGCAGCSVALSTRARRVAHAGVR